MRDEDNNDNKNDNDNDYGQDDVYDDVSGDDNAHPQICMSHKSKIRHIHQKNIDEHIWTCLLKVADVLPTRELYMSTMRFRVSEKEHDLNHSHNSIDSDLFDVNRIAYGVLYVSLLQ